MTPKVHFHLAGHAYSTCGVKVSGAQPSRANVTCARCRRSLGMRALKLQQVGRAERNDVMTDSHPHFLKNLLPAALRVTPALLTRDHISAFLAKPMAFTRVDCPGNDMGGVRIYKSSPDRVSFQIRTTGKITASRRGQCRPSYSHVELNAADIAAVVAELLRLQQELTP